MQVQYIKSEDDIADMFTKPISKDKFEKLKNKAHIK